MKRCALIVLLVLTGCGGEERAATPCSPPPVHRGGAAGVWIAAAPEKLRLIGTLGYWPEDWGDVERAQVFTVGNGPTGRPPRRCGASARPTSRARAGAT